MDKVKNMEDNKDIALIMMDALLVPKWWNDFAGVDEVLRIECLFDAMHDVNGGIVKLLPNQLHLSPPDAMFARACAA